VTAVDDVSFEVAQGELVTLLGPSGCGKTTTLRMVAGLEAVTSGRVLIGGKDVTLRAANERDVSMVFQSYALFPHMTVLENVCYGPISMRIDKARARELAREKLRMLGLADFENRLPSELSGGQQQRVAVARSLVLEPAVLLFDEPLSNLDAKLRRRVREEIRELQQSLALTVLYVTHDQEEALAVSDHIIVMNGGKIAQQGTPNSLYEAPNSRFLADFIGDANPRRRRARARGRPRLVCRRRVSAPVRANGMEAGRRRSPCGRSACAWVDVAQGVVPGVCKRVAYLGSRIEYVVSTAWGELLAFDNELHPARRRDDAVGIAFDPDAVIVLPR
jgi:iron(III) transport system ATP-binding protein